MEQELKQTLFLVLIGLFIICMIVLIVFLVKEKNLINKDPIIYGIEKHGFQSCNCYIDNKMITFNNPKNIQLKLNLTIP